MLSVLLFTRLHPSPLSLLPSLSPSQVLEQQPDPRVAELVRLSPSWGLPVSEALHLSEPSGCSGAFGKRSGVLRGGGQARLLLESGAKRRLDIRLGSAELGV